MERQSKRVGKDVIENCDSQTKKPRPPLLPDLLSHPHRQVRERNTSIHASIYAIITPSITLPSFNSYPPPLHPSYSHSHSHFYYSSYYSYKHHLSPHNKDVSVLPTPSGLQAYQRHRQHAAAASPSSLHPILAVYAGHPSPRTGLR